MIDAAQDEAQRLWKDGNEAYRQRDYGRAHELLKALLDQHGEGAGGVDPALARLQLGNTLLRLERTEEGVAELLRAVRLDPYSGRARYKLGIGLARLDRSEEALAALEQATILAPNEPDHLWRWGEELRRCRRYNEAREAVGDALALKPDHAEALETMRQLKAESRWLRRLIRFAKS